MVNKFTGKSIDPNMSPKLFEFDPNIEYLGPSTKQFSPDLRILCGGYEFLVHKDTIGDDDLKCRRIYWICANYPPVSHGVKIQIELNEYEPDIVRRALQFGYTGELQLGEVMKATDTVLIEQERANNPAQIALHGLQPWVEENRGSDQVMQANCQSEYRFDLCFGMSGAHLWVSKKSPEELQKFTPTEFSQRYLTTLTKIFLFAMRNSWEQLLRATMAKYEKLLGSVPGILNPEVWMESLKMMNKGVNEKLRKELLKPQEPEERQRLKRLSDRLKKSFEEEPARKSATSLQQQPGTVSHPKCGNCSRTHPGECWKCSFCERYGHLDNMCFKNPESISYRGY